MDAASPPLDELLAPLTADAGTINRAVRLTHALDVWTTLQTAVKLLRAHDVCTLIDRKQFTIADLAEKLDVTTTSVYRLAKIARDAPDEARTAHLPSPFRKLLSPFTTKPGTLDRLLRLNDLTERLPGLKHDLALLRSEDVLAIHRHDGLTYRDISASLGLTSERAHGIASLAKGTYVSRNTRRNQGERTTASTHNEGTKAVQETMRTYKGPWSVAQIVESSGRSLSLVQRTLTKGLDDGTITPAGTLPIGKEDRNVRVYTAS